MKKISFFTLFLAIMGLTWFSACDNGGDDPQPTTIVFNLTSATLDGSAITPLPNYSLTVNFDADGNPDGYSASGNAQYTPSVGSSGTFSVSNNQVTFTSGSDSKTVSITAGSISNTATTVSLQWSLTKIDDGVPPQDEGTYVYQMTAQ